MSSTARAGAVTDQVGAPLCCDTNAPYKGLGSRGRCWSMRMSTMFGRC